MNRFSLSHLLDGEVVRGLEANLAKERDALADVLAHIAEVEARKLYVPAGYESMHDYCVRRLHLSKDSAYKRITAARKALEFPVIFERVAEGALSLAVVNVLAPSLTAENSPELLAAASFKTREEVQELLAERFPREAVPTTIEPIAQPMTLAATSEAEETNELAPGRVQRVVNPPRVMPLASDLYKLQLTMTGEMYAKLQRAVNLFGRRKPVPDEAEILELGLDLLVEKLEKKKFCATDKPKPRKPCAEDHIPAEVQREVWVRDGGQCTFHGEDGTCCAAKKDLQFDHIIPGAKGGRSDDPKNLRLRCHAHNQYAAEQEFGKQFMEGKRERAAAERARRRMEKEAERAARRAEKEAGRERVRAAAAERRAAEKTERERTKSTVIAEPDADLEEVMQWPELSSHPQELLRLAASSRRTFAWMEPDARRELCLALVRERVRPASSSVKRPDPIVAPGPCVLAAPARDRDIWTGGPALDPADPNAW